MIGSSTPSKAGRSCWLGGQARRAEGYAVATTTLEETVLRSIGVLTFVGTLVYCGYRHVT